MNTTPNTTTSDQPDRFDGALASARDGSATDRELVIETRALTKRYGEAVVAVDDLALRVRRGEVYGFLGPNGAGKTTTLDAARPGATDIGSGSGARRAVRLAAGAGAHRVDGRGFSLLSVPVGARQPACPRRPTNPRGLKPSTPLGSRPPHHQERTHT